MPNPDRAPASPAEASGITVLIQRWKHGDAAARDLIAARLLPELRALAERELRKLPQPVSLHASDLVQESVIELLRRGAASGDAAHLKALAANIVRTTLIDYLRTRHAQKRGARDTENVSITVLANLGAEAPAQVDLIAIHEAMQALERSSPRAARIVELRVFGGLSETEIADVLGVSRPTVSRDWATAKLWLARELSGTTTHNDKA